MRYVGRIECENLRECLEKAAVMVRSVTAVYSKKRRSLKVNDRFPNGSSERK